MALRVVTQEAQWTASAGGTLMAIQEDGAGLPTRTILNFATGIVAADNPTENRIDITVPVQSGGGGGELPDPFTAPLSQGNVAVGISSTLVVNANAGRGVLVLTNGSDTGVWVWFAATGANVGQGTYLAPQSSPLVLPYNGAASAIHVGASGTKTLGVTEF